MFPKVIFPVAVMAALPTLPLILGVGEGVAHAQVVHDASLEGAEQSLVTRQENSDDIDLVLGGARRGGSLFHSFEQLNVAEGRSLYFTHAEGIDQIFSRVTGSNPSNIDGTLGVLGNADLFLLNPNGILFGSNAQLDLSGSFTASAAAGLKFEGFEFSATQPQAVPLLNISAPLGLNFGTNPGSIVNRSTTNGTGLTINNSFQTLSLSGGHIALEGGAVTLADGRIELTSVGDILLTNQATVRLDSSVVNPDAGIRLAGQRLESSGRAKITTQAGSAPGGSIQVDVEALSLSGGGRVESLAFDKGRGGDIAVSAQSITIDGLNSPTAGALSGIFSDTLASADGGHISINAQDVTLGNGGDIFTFSRASGDGGNIYLDVSNTILSQGLFPTSSDFGSEIATDSVGSGRGGDLFIAASQIDLRDGARIASNAWDTGPGGNVTLTVSDSLQATGINPFLPALSSGVVSFTLGAGQGGNISVSAPSITFQEGSGITAGTLGNRDTFARSRPFDFGELLEQLPVSHGVGGAIAVTADQILIRGGSIIALEKPSGILSVTTSMGEGGDVDVMAHQLDIQEGGILSANSIFSTPLLGEPMLPLHRGQGGDIRVTVDEIDISGVNPHMPLGSFIGTLTGSDATAGDVDIVGKTLSLSEGATVNAGTLSMGSSGNISILMSDAVMLDGRYATELPTAVGIFADIPDEQLQAVFSLPPIPMNDIGTRTLSVVTDQIKVSNGALLGAQHAGIGNAGGIDIRARQMLLDDGVITTTTTSGQGGNISLELQSSLQMRNGSQITTTVLEGSGDGGNISVQAGTILAIPSENSDIIANAVGGRGGNVRITTSGLFGIQFREQLTPQSDITASSQAQLDGAVSIELRSPNPGSSVAAFPALLRLDELIASNCLSTKGSSFIITGRGGLPQDPRYQLGLLRPLQDWRLSLPNH